MKQIYKLDSTLFRSSSCAHRFNLMGIVGLKEKGLFNDTMYGVAFHKFLARMQESNGNFAEAVKAARIIFSNPAIKVREKKEHLDEKHLIKTCLDYWEYSSKDNSSSLLINPIAKCWKCLGQTGPEICQICEGKGILPTPMVEQTFSISVYEEDEFRIDVEGTLDEIEKIKNGCYCVSDYKTSSSWQPDKYIRPYILSPQLRLYVWALRTIAKQNPDGLLAPLIKAPIGARIKGIFLKTKQETQFINSEVYQFKEADMQEFELLLNLKVQQYVGLIKKQIPPIRNGKIEGTCMSPFGCAYFNLCAANDDITRQYMINKFYETKPYLPLHFHDE